MNIADALAEQTLHCVYVAVSQESSVVHLISLPVCTPLPAVLRLHSLMLIHQIVVLGGIAATVWR